jgi:hypothetical protein
MMFLLTRLHSYQPFNPAILPLTFLLSEVTPHTPGDGKTFPGDGKTFTGADACLYSQKKWRVLEHGMSDSLPEFVTTEHRPDEVRPLTKYIFPTPFKLLSASRTFGFAASDDVEL